MFKHFLKVCGLAALAYPLMGSAVQITSLGALGANDGVQWNASSVVHLLSFPATSNGGIQLTITEATGGYSLGQQAPAGGFNGDFPANAYIVDNNWGGPTTYAFTTPITGFGVSLDNAWSTLTSTASIQAYHGNTLLGSFSVIVPGSTLAFLGVLDTIADIDSVTVTSDSPNGNGYYAFGDLAMVDAAAPTSGVPEPATAAIVLPVIAGLIAWRRRRISASQGAAEGIR